MASTLKAEPRIGNTKGDRKKMREQGKIPGVVYGKKISQTPIAIEQKELLALLKSNPHAIIEMDVLETGKQTVMINEVQRDPISRQLLHVDFHQISMDEPVNTTVRLEFTGDPVGAQMGGILQIQHHELEIRCLPRDIPNVIHVDISQLELGDNMHVSQLQLPEAIEVKADGHEVLATILAPQKEILPETDAEGDKAAGAAEKAEETV